MPAVKKTELWTIAIALAAFLVSAATWLDVHEQVRLARGQVRSFVQVVQADLVESITDASFIKVRLRIKNFGQTAATNVYGEMDYSVGIPDPDGKGNQATRIHFGSMAPGLERSVVLQSNRINRRDWPYPSSRGLNSVYFFGTIWFTDFTTHEELKEDWCYELPLKTEADLHSVELSQCGTLTYTSK